MSSSRVAALARVCSHSRAAQRARHPSHFAPPTPPPATLDLWGLRAMAGVGGWCVCARVDARGGRRISAQPRALAMWCNCNMRCGATATCDDVRRRRAAACAARIRPVAPQRCCGFCCPPQHPTIGIDAMRHAGAPSAVLIMRGVRRALHLPSVLSVCGSSCCVASPRRVLHTAPHRKRRVRQTASQVLHII